MSFIYSLRKPIFPPRCILDPSNKSCSKRNEIRKRYNSYAVFLNTPYEEEYVQIEFAIWITLYLHGLNPKLVRRERGPGVRLCKICRLMQCCGYGITDFSYYKLNVAYEHGLLYALGKPTALLTDDRHALDKVLSNLRGMDPISHKMDSKKLIIDLTDWIEANWGNATTRIKKEITFECWGFLKNVFQESNRYSYANINLFYEELEDLLEGFLEEVGRDIL